MTRRRPLSLVLIGTLFAASALPVFAQTTTSTSAVDCSSVFSTDKKQSYKANPDDVHQCIMRGYDPPTNWRPNNGNSPGTRVGGTMGFTYGTVEAPQNPPGAVGAPSNVSNALMNFALSFASSSSDSATGGNSSSSSGVPSSNSCPVSSDTTGLFGIHQAIAASATPLSCGGALPLTTYEMVLNANADRLATTENGQYYIWLYQKSGNNYQTMGGTYPAAMPTYLCKSSNTCNNSTGEDCTKFPITAPVAQVITYNSGVQNILVHLDSPMTQEDDTNLVTSQSQPEHYLVIPIVGGVPQVPANCADYDTYYKTASSLTFDMVIHPAVDQSCENNAAVAAGQTACTQAMSTSSPLASCETLNMSLSGSPAGVVCDGKIQYAVLDRTNLLYPPGSSPIFSSVPDHTGMLAPSNGSVLYAQPEAVFEIGPSAPSISMPQGGTIIMQDNSRLVMGGPATLNPAGRSVSMVNGGVLVSAGGSVITNFGNNSSYTMSNPVLPLRLQLESSLTMPSGYMMMTQPTPYVLLPIAKPQ